MPNLLPDTPKATKPVRDLFAFACALACLVLVVMSWQTAIADASAIYHFLQNPKAPPQTSTLDFFSINRHIWPLSLLSQSADLVRGINGILFVTENTNHKDIPITSSLGFPERSWEKISTYIQTSRSSLLALNQGLNLEGITWLAELHSRIKAKTARSTLGAVASLSQNSEAGLVLLDTLMRGEKNLLIFFQNNNELRATGGFIGTYGELTLSNGEVKNMHIDTVYNLDGQLPGLEGPPAPLVKVNPKWYFRDSNWFTDFKTTSEKATKFLEKAGHATPDCTLALTPDVFVKLLKVSGPISLPEFNITLTSENFVETTQVATSVSYRANTPENPKAMLAVFAERLLSNLKNQNSNGRLQVLQATLESLRQKDILISCRDPQTQTLLEEYNWAGRVVPHEQDYVYVNSSNLSGTKTDRYIKEGYTMSVHSKTKRISHTLTITRENFFDKGTLTDNLSYYRVFLPKGVDIVNVSGNSESPITDIRVPVSEDPDVLSWNANVHPAGFPDVDYGKESGMDFLGFWVFTPGKTKQIITLQYTTPVSPENPENYQLIWQKQPGKNKVSVDLNIEKDGQDSVWQSENLDRNLEYHGILDQDLVFSSIFR